MNYNVVAKVNQIVTKEVHLVITAGSEEEAQAKATEALVTYPSKISTEGISNIVTVKQNYWTPKSIDVTKTTLVKEVKTDGN